VDILKKCNNPNVVTYFGCVKASSSADKSPSRPPVDSKPPLWILMDYCAGGSIRDYMDRSKKNLTEEQVGSVLTQTILGLSYLHSIGIIHRDLKSGNLLLTEGGVVKVADFGISTQLSATITGNAKTMIGTTYWMAPEIMDESYSYKIDIWSLGITAIEMVEGEPPNWNLKPFQLMIKLPKDPPPKLKDGSKFSKEFVDFITNCLQKDPTKRPDTKKLTQLSFILSVAKIGQSGITDILKPLVTQK